ncbi:hypothetical protein CLV46_0656 [Diaminobutyricimonas aerilata]|uniref:Uncharacterized protein n=1 Tax=Diaminobutyricimonas aerilata TaxID=1162967 RepID=A0A2M9CGV5_9MICO|nr:hypothetical protein [Diaminobutyricimonas aerilata]PJJ71117.1 hypothetical protein CLV46_0656 [Diaminobutyricimonas aerilata]
MTGRERTSQQLDPLGGLGARPATRIVLLNGLAYGLFRTVERWDSLDLPMVGIAALLTLGIATVLLDVVSSPRRAPMLKSHFVAVALLGLTSLVLSLMSMWHGREPVLDDWAPVTLGALLIAASPYRPARELLGATILLTLAVGFIALLQAAPADSAPETIQIIVTAVPVLALGLGGAAFADSSVRSIEHWQGRADAATRDLTRSMYDGLARSVQQDRVTILNRDVVPFFTSLLERGEITPADAERARRISDSIRRVMVAEVDRSWLDHAIDDLGRVSGRESLGAESVDDGERLAPLMSSDQRAAVRALLGELVGLTGFDPDGFSVRLASVSGDPVGRPESAARSVQVTMRALVTAGAPELKRRLEPYRAVLRVLFHDTAIDVLPPVVTLKFRYDL